MQSNVHEDRTKHARSGRGGGCREEGVENLHGDGVPFMHVDAEANPNSTGTARCCR